MQPKLKYMNPIFGAHILMIMPNDARIAPAITVLRYPNLLQSALTIGPEQVFKTLTLIISSIPNKIGRCTMIYHQLHYKVQS